MKKNIIKPALIIALCVLTIFAQLINFKYVFFERYQYDTEDAVKILNIVVGTVDPDKEDFKKYDFNQDGYIRTGDSTICQRLINGEYRVILKVERRKP